MKIVVIETSGLVTIFRGHEGFGEYLRVVGPDPNRVAVISKMGDSAEFFDFLWDGKMNDRQIARHVFHKAGELRREWEDRAKAMQEADSVRRNKHNAEFPDEPKW